LSIIAGQPHHLAIEGRQFTQWEKFIPDWQRMLDMPCK
jgi:hypothetical protein